MYHIIITTIFILSTVTGQQPCSFGDVLCSGGERNRNKFFRRHDTPDYRGLSGEYLDNLIAGMVPENTMRCLTYKTRRCDEETCQLNEYSRKPLPVPLHPARDTNRKFLQSPRFSEIVKKPNRQWGSRFFCIYNVSLSCPESNAVQIKLSEFHNSWPVNSEEHQNYVAFYSSKNKDRSAFEYSGGTSGKYVLDSESFVAIMWNGNPKYVNKGIFSFETTCAKASATKTTTAQQLTTSSTQQSPTAISSTEEISTGTQYPTVGSGDNDLSLTQD